MTINIIIPARKGSKGVPNKNLLLIGGVPLFQRSINHALGLKDSFPIKIFVSTDIESILLRNNTKEIIYYRRPDILCGDTALTFEVVLDVIKTFSIPNHQIIILFQPTTPFRDLSEISNSINFFKNQDYFHSLVSISDVDGNHPFRMKRINKMGEIFDFIDQGFENMIPRQDLPKVFIRSGSFYISKVSHIIEKSNLLPKPCKGIVHGNCKLSVNIDKQEDVAIANYFINLK